MIELDNLVSLFRAVDSGAEAGSVTLKMQLGKVYRELAVQAEGVAPSSPAELLACAHALDKSTRTRRLIAYLFRLHAYKLVPLELGQAEADDSGVHTLDAVDGVAELGPAIVSMFVEEFAALMLKVGAAKSGLQLVDEFLSRLPEATEAAGAEVAVARLGALKAKLDLLIEIGRWRQDTRANARLTGLANHLKFLDEELSPALDLATSLVGDRFPPILDEHRYLRHRRMDLENRLAVERGEPPPWRLSDWKSLRDEFLAAGDPLNADRASIAGLQNFLLVARDADLQREGLAARVREMTPPEDRLRAADTVDSWSVRQTVTSVLTMLGDWEDVGAVLETVRGEIEEALASSVNEVSRSRVLSAANDWLGIALRYDMRRDPRVGAAFSALYRVIRGRDFAVPRASNTSTVALLTFRTGAAVGVVSDSEETWLFHRDGRPILTALDRLHALGHADYRAHRSNKRGAPAAEWESALSTLTARVGAPSAKLESDRLLVWSEDSRLPTHALFLDGSERTILGVLPNLPRVVPQSPRESDPVVFVDGFTPGEPLSTLLREICKRKNGVLVPAASPEDLCAALSQPARLFVLGCHGVQGKLLGDLKVELGGRSFAVEGLLERVCLPARSQVLCFTCFGSGGALNALMEHGSLPYEFLRAGALSVTANCWPAWFYPSRPDDLGSVIDGLSDSSLAADPWAGAEAVGRRVRAWRASRRPKWWAGWSTWIADCGENSARETELATED